jgi:hypothetical protein
MQTFLSKATERNMNVSGSQIETRVLPDFLIVGAQRSGTTSLFHFLSRHDEFISATPKEVHYFDGGLNPAIDHYQLGESWYRDHFPVEEDVGRRKVFEATPLYLFNPFAAQRIYETLPDVKIVVLLRNPAHRAVSNYFLERKLGREKRPIMEAMMQEEKVIANALRNQDFKSDEYIHCTYKHRGHYKEQLERYFKYFPPESVLIIQSEKFFSEPAIVVSRLFAFLGIDRDYSVLSIEHKNAIDKNTSVDGEVYQYLNQYFSSYNKQLYDYIGQEFSW